MDRVYSYTKASTPEDVLRLANWLRANGQGIDSLGQPKAVALNLRLHGRGKGIYLATPREVIGIDLKSPIFPALLGVLRTNIVDQPQSNLRMRDMFQDIVDLSLYFAKEFDLPLREVYGNLAPWCVGDLRQASNIIGLPSVGHDHYKDGADDAYEVALYGPQYEAGIGGYYSKVALPFARLQAEATLLTDATVPADWFVQYDDLWLRVFAHFSQDPSLGFIFTDGRPVRRSVAGTLGIDPVQADALLHWQAVDREMTTFQKLFPSRVDDLPENLPRYALELDKHYAVLCASTLAMRQAYWESRASHTLYGRMLRPGHTPGEAVAHRIFGTVEDIVSVAAVTFWQNRTSAEVMISKITGGPDAQELRIKGVGPSAGKELWRQALTPLADLGNPMQVTLDPKVVFP